MADWDLVIATYNRPEILKLAVRLAATQTRPPKGIYVVDAGPDPAGVAELVRQDLQKHGAGHIPYTHVPAQVTSLTVQRNQGVAMASAEVLFLIDDDSLMYPNCAEKIMEVYDADTAHVIAGVQAVEVRISPMDTTDPAELQSVEKKEGGGSKGPMPPDDRPLINLRRWFDREVLLMDRRMLFIPYDGHFHDPPRPPCAEIYRTWPTPLFHGCRMTFRRDVLLKEPAEPLLRYYAAAEDLDLSYRASRHGHLLNCGDAKLYHHTAGGGRMSRKAATALGILNIAAFTRKHSNDLERDGRKVRTLVRRRLLAEALKDLLTRRFDFPQFRGILLARPHVKHILKMSLSQLEEAYPELQSRLKEM
ncbi:MAG: glycosyltransferase family 2 protein [Phycisphaerae bacterium]